MFSQHKNRIITQWTLRNHCGHAFTTYHLLLIGCPVVVWTICFGSLAQMSDTVVLLGTISKYHLQRQCWNVIWSVNDEWSWKYKLKKKQKNESQLHIETKINMSMGQSCASWHEAVICKNRYLHFSKFCTCLFCTLLKTFCCCKNRYFYIYCTLISTFTRWCYIQLDCKTPEQGGVSVSTSSVSSETSAKDKLTVNTWRYYSLCHLVFNVSMLNISELIILCRIKHPVYPFVL